MTTKKVVSISGKIECTPAKILATPMHQRPEVIINDERHSQRSVSLPAAVSTVE